MNRSEQSAGKMTSFTRAKWHVPRSSVSISIVTQYLVLYADSGQLFRFRKRGDGGGRGLGRRSRSVQARHGIVTHLLVWARVAGALLSQRSCCVHVAKLLRLKRSC